MKLSHTSLVRGHETESDLTETRENTRDLDMTAERGETRGGGPPHLQADLDVAHHPNPLQGTGREIDITTSPGGTTGERIEGDTVDLIQERIGERRGMRNTARREGTPPLHQKVEEAAALVADDPNFTLPRYHHYGVLGFWGFGEIGRAHV